MSAAIVPTSHSKHHAHRHRKVIPASTPASATSLGLAAPVIAAIPIRPRRPARRNNALPPDSKIGHLGETICPTPDCAAADASPEAGDGPQHGRPERRGQAASWRHVMAPSRRRDPGPSHPRQPGSCPPGLGTAASSPTAITRRYATYDIRPMRKASETIGDPSANNTRATPVRVPEKINTRITRTKRRYPAHGDTTATMAM